MHIETVFHQADVNFVNPDFLLFFESVNKSKQTEFFFVDSNKTKRFFSFLKKMRF